MIRRSFLVVNWKTCFSNKRCWISWFFYLLYFPMPWPCDMHICVGITWPGQGGARHHGQMTSVTSPPGRQREAISGTLLPSSLPRREEICIPSVPGGSWRREWMQAGNLRHWSKTWNCISQDRLLWFTSGRALINDILDSIQLFSNNTLMRIGTLQRKWKQDWASRT